MKTKKYSLWVGVALLSLFLIVFASWQTLRNQSLSKALNQMGGLYENAFALQELKKSAEEMRGPMYQYIVTGSDSALDLFKERYEDFVGALEVVKEDYNLQEWKDIWQEVLSNNELLHQEILDLKEKMNNFPQASSIIAQGVESKISKITDGLGDMVDWIDIEIEDNRRNVNKLSWLKLLPHKQVGQTSVNR